MEGVLVGKELKSPASIKCLVLCSLMNDLIDFTAVFLAVGSCGK